jgi:predicted Zn-ribbon and HTH transcriptional regulator
MTTRIAGFRCNNCGAEGQSDEMELTVCPACGSHDIELGWFTLDDTQPDDEDDEDEDDLHRT